MKLPGTYKNPKLQDKLQQYVPLENAEYFQHAFDSYSLEGRVLYAKSHDAPRILSLHGARSDYTKSDPVLTGLQKRGYSSLAFSMSGHSPAGVLPLAETSLGNNVAEAQTFFTYLDTTSSRIVIGYSLGGTPALKVLEKHLHEVDKVVLFYPGIYDADAYDKPYGEPFREVISRPFSYRNNDTIGTLRQFKGKLLLICGQYDGLDPVMYGKPAGTSAGEVVVDGTSYSSPIPKEVIDMIRGAVPGNRCRYIEIPNCGHQVMAWMRQNPGPKEALLDQIVTFLKS